MGIIPDAKLYIDGKLRDAAGGRTYDNIGPWTGATIGRAPDAGREDVEAAIVAARRAFDTTDWPVAHDRRLALVTKLRNLMQENRQVLVDIACHEAGAAIGAANAAHVQGALAGFDGLLAAFPHVTWEEDRGRSQNYGMSTDRTVIYEPVGVVGAITPWNVPLYVNIGKVAAALLAGCTVILKPAPDTPVMGTYMGELAAQAGFPPGVFNVITALDPVMAGEMLVTDPRVDLISFTGSTAVGKRIMEKGAATLKRVFLELGGKSAMILLDDAPNFTMSVMRSILVFHAGQGCAVTSRLLVPRSRYAEAITALETAYAGYAGKWGSNTDPAHMMGPVASKRQMDRVMSYIELGQKEGARLLAGGKMRPDLGSGYFIEPTCFVDVTNEMRIAREEIFGPVLVVIAYEDDEDAIRISNDSEYGLCGGVVSADTARAMRIARRIRTGTFSVNYGMCIAGDLPFGGYKSSGIGREWGREGIEEFLETKAIGIGVAA